MRLIWIAFSFATICMSQDIQFTDRVVTFTNLQGNLFEGVSLIKADLDGVIWRKEASGGRVIFTNLSPELIESWGIPTNRIAIARERAAKSAANHSAMLHERAIDAQSEAIAKESQRRAWEAGAPARALLQQIQTDLKAIEDLQAWIETSKSQIRRARAAAADYNSANLYNDYAPYVYIKQSSQVEVDEAETRLARMRFAFNSKYTADDIRKAKTALP